MSAFLSSHIFPTADTYEKVLLQLLAAYHFIASGLKFKLREPISADDTGQQAVISRNGPYLASDGTTRVTYVLHLQVAEDVDSTAYAGTWEAGLEMTTAPVAASFINQV